MWPLVWALAVFGFWNAVQVKHVKQFTVEAITHV